MLDAIKSSIDSNSSLDKMTKDKLFELILIFNKKIPEVNLERFNRLVKTVKLGRISKYENLGTSIYDVKNNEILFSPDKLQLDYDLDNLFMRSVLGMITSTGVYSGFASDPDLNALNSAYEEILANYLVGNGEISDQEEEMIITNIIGNIIGNDTLYKAYFTNNGQVILDILNKIENNSKVLELLERMHQAKLNGVLNSGEFANCLNVSLDTAVKAIQKGIPVNLKAIEILIPSSPTALLYNHQNLSEVAKKSHAITEYFCKQNNITNKARTR